MIVSDIHGSSSIVLPKENSSHGYMIMDDETVEWKNFDGSTYHKELIAK